MGGRGASSEAARMVVAVVGVVVAAAAVLSPSAAGGLGREGTCRTATSPQRIVFHSSSALSSLLPPSRPGQSDQRSLAQILCSQALFLVPAAEFRRCLVVSCGMQRRRWWRSRRRCRIRAKFSATGTLSPATRAAGTWSPAMGATFRSCMLLL